MLSRKTDGVSMKLSVNNYIKTPTAIKPRQLSSICDKLLQHKYTCYYWYIVKQEQK